MGTAKMSSVPIAVISVGFVYKDFLVSCDYCHYRACQGCILLWNLSHSGIIMMIWGFAARLFPGGRCSSSSLPKDHHITQLQALASPATSLLSHHESLGRGTYYLKWARNVSMFALAQKTYSTLTVLHELGHQVCCVEDTLGQQWVKQVQHKWT